MSEEKKNVKLKVIGPTQTVRYLSTEREGQNLKGLLGLGLEKIVFCPDKTIMGFYKGGKTKEIDIKYLRSILYLIRIRKKKK